MSTTTMPPESRRITPKFNLALFAFNALAGIIKFSLLARVGLGGLILTSFLDAVLTICILLIVAWFVKEFWIRLISDLFSLRNIDYQEAIAIVLVLSMLGLS
ncbi:hypothetical protein [Gimesia maris]|uniref:Uncharacterized protein n=1 Tax=Gimesia maris TaxID=122 RepID=A0ABX5YS56_9PLAN|nr:hypothetical protein [Gimesia maris]EDL61980.1 hypothetical protein PM8797T_22013 [Gimesia maris DSM 8797]QEG18471.1 hypothetical protein GmarT_43600 [Gimesia maris]QGQ28558.1 hypothetical protein F1729_07815 [Gimesia maris]